MTIFECPKCKKKYLLKDSVKPRQKYLCKACGFELSPAADGVFQPGDITAAELSDFLAEAPEDAVNAYKANHKIIDNKYILVQKLGSGGAGVVYRAWDSVLKRYVALKMLLPVMENETDEASASGETLKRFIFEAQTAAKLSHPNILEVFEIEKHDGDYCIVMEYANNGALDEYLRGKKNGKNPPSAAEIRNYLIWMKEIIKAVDYAHRNNVIHRDIKPENILLVQDNCGEIVLKVSDFGLAKEISSIRRLTAAGTVMGTPEYMSPEQANAEQLDVRTDVFSLGAVLYKICAGVDPFYGKSILDVIDAVVNKDPVPPSTMNKTVDRDLELIILKAIEKDRERRYVSAGELAEDIGRYLRGEPVSARPPSIIYKLLKKISRHRQMAAGIALAAAAVLGIILWTHIVASNRGQAADEYLHSAEGYYDKQEWKNALDNYIKYTELAGPEPGAEAKKAACRDKIKGHEEELARVFAEAEKRKKELEAFAEEEKKAEEEAQQAWLYAAAAFKDFYRENADIAQSWGRINEGIDMLGKSISAHPSAMGYFYRGVLFREKNMFAEAERDLTEAIRLNPDYDTAYLMRGLVYFDRLVRIDVFNFGDLPAPEKLALFDEMQNKAAGDFRKIKEGAKIPGDFAVYRSIVESLIKYGFNSREVIKFLSESGETDKSEEFLYWTALNSHTEPAVADLYLGKVLEIKPYHAKSLFLLGLSCNIAGEVEEAIAYYTKAVNANPYFVEAYVNRGGLYYETGNADAAFADADAAVRIDPALPDAYLNRGNARLQNGDKSGAYADYEKALELNRNYYQAYFNRGVLKMNDGALDLAVMDFDAALRIEPGGFDAYNNRGSVKFKKGDFSGAIDDFSSAIELNAANAVFHENRGSAYYATGNLKKAVEDWSKAAQLMPDNADYYWRCGTASRELGDIDGALKNYNIAIDKAPLNDQYYFDRGSVKLQKNDISGAISDFNESIRLNPGSAIYYYGRGTANISVRDYDAATGDLDLAIRLKPNFADAWFSRGYIKGLKGDPDGALADYNNALLINPGYQPAYNNRGGIKYGKNDWQGAFDDFSEAIRLDANDAIVYLNRGRVLRKMDKYQQALDDFKKAVQLNPEFKAKVESEFNDVKWD